MAKIKRWIVNLKVAGKLKAYRLMVLIMTVFLVLVTLISTMVIRSNIREITEVWSPAVEYIQELETMTSNYRVKQYQHLVETDPAVLTACEAEIENIAGQITETGKELDAIMNSDKEAQAGKADYDEASSAWNAYKEASEEILQLSSNGEQAEAAELMTGSVYESYKNFGEKLNILRNDFQVKLDESKSIANLVYSYYFYCDRGDRNCDDCSIDNYRKDDHELNYRAGSTDRGSSCQPEKG